MQANQPAPPKLNLNQYMPQQFKEDSPRSAASDHSSDAATAHAGPATPDITPPLLPSRIGRQPAASLAAPHAGISSPAAHVAPDSVSAVAEAMLGTYAARTSIDIQQVVPDMIQLTADVRPTADVRASVDVGPPLDMKPPADVRAPVAFGPANRITARKVKVSSIARASISVQSVVPDTVQLISSTAQSAAGHNPGSAEVEQHRGYFEEQHGAQESCSAGRTADSRVWKLTGDEDHLFCCPISHVSVCSLRDLEPCSLYAPTCDCTLVAHAYCAAQSNLSARPGV